MALTNYGSRFLSPWNSHRHYNIKVVKFVRLGSCYEDPGDEDPCLNFETHCLKVMFLSEENSLFERGDCCKKIGMADKGLI